MSSASYRSLRVFEGLCGDMALPTDILLTTMWDKMTGELEPTAKVHEEALKSRYWINMIQLGARAQRFNNTRERALDIVSVLLAVGANEQAVLLQEELVDLGRELNETYAGRTLCSQLQTDLSQRKETIQALQRQAKERNNPWLKAELEAELGRIHAHLDEISLQQISWLKIGFWRKTALIFGPSQGMVVDTGRELNETQAQNLQLRTALLQQKEAIQVLRMQVISSHPMLEIELDAELTRIQTELDKTVTQTGKSQPGVSVVVPSEPTAKYVSFHRHFP